MTQHPLLPLLLDAVEGRYPVADGGVTVLPALEGGLECSVGFTGHGVIASALPEEGVRAYGPDGYGGALAPDFLRQLAGPAGWIGVTDVTLYAYATGGEARLPMRNADDGLGSARVAYARELRSHVRVFGDERGLVTLAHGVAGRDEVSIELAQPSSPSRGVGRSLLGDALSLLPAGTPVFAAVAPGNARSLRSFLAAGFTPLGSEVLLRPAR